MPILDPIPMWRMIARGKENHAKPNGRIRWMALARCAGPALAVLFLLLVTLPAVAEEDGDSSKGPVRIQEPDPESSVKPGALWGTVIHRDQFRPLTGAERWELYWRQAYWTPGAFFRVAGPALGAHLGNEPPEWGQGAEGYARRLANRFARTTIQDSIEAAGSAVVGYDVRYVRSGKKGFFPRLGHAIAWNFLSLNREGKTVFNAPRVGSAFAAEFIGNTWMPEGHRSGSQALKGVGVQLAVGSLFNAVREFAPKK